MDKCRKDNGHDVRYRPGPLAEFRRVLMQCLLYRSRLHLLLSPYLCFISLLYLDLYVLGDDALIS